LKKIIIFGGTGEGRKIADYLAKMRVSVSVCIATEYGREFISERKGMQIISKRMSKDEISEIIEDYDLVIDATHPFAEIVTENIKSAVTDKKKEYLRIIRNERVDLGFTKQTGYEFQEKAELFEESGVRVFESIKEACRYLNRTYGNILVATGSKNLLPYTEINNYKERIYLRILPIAEGLEKCRELGFKSSNVICMQGPFNEDLNEAMLKHTASRFFVTKDSGESGGVFEKIKAGKRAGAEVIIVKRPKREKGLTLEEAYAFLSKRFSKITEMGSIR